MINPNDIAMLEKYDAVVNAKAGVKCMNGSFGIVTEGVFAPAENGDCFIYQKHKGDNMYTDFNVMKDENVRVAQLKEWNGRLLKISPVHLAEGKFKVGDKYASNAEGKLVAGASAAPYVEVIELINYDGVGARARIVAE